MDSITERRTLWWGTAACNALARAGGRGRLPERNSPEASALRAVAAAPAIQARTLMCVRARVAACGAAGRLVVALAHV